MMVVYAKEGDGKNVHVSNLFLTDCSGRTRRIFERGRLIKDIESTCDEYVRTNAVQSANISCKQVSQYTREGIYINTYPSILVASLMTGVSESGILSVLKGRQVTSGGFAWAYGIVDSVDVQAIRAAHQENRNRLVGQKLTQYDLKGQRIATYYTIAEAARQTNIADSDIHAVLNGRQRSAGGYIWRKGFGKSSINVAGYLTGVAFRASKRRKKVTRYTTSGEAVAHYESLKQAGIEEALSPTNISMAIKKKRLIRGFLWKFSK